MQKLFNIPVKPFKLIQKRDDNSDYTVNGITYKYIKDTSASIKGIKQNYDSSGYQIDIDINNVNDFYSSMNLLSDWLNGAVSILLYGIVYNINIDIYIGIDFLYEKIGNRYIRTFKRSICNLNPINDHLTIPLFILLGLHLIFLFISLFIRARTNINSSIEATVSQTVSVGKMSNTSLSKEKKSSNKCIACPNGPEILSIINIGFSLYCLITKISYESKAKKLTINSDLDSFISKMNVLSNLLTTNILLYFLGIVYLILNFMSDLTILTNAIISYMKQIGRIFLFFIIPIILISYCILKYSIVTYPFMNYLHAHFLLLKTISMFIRGTISNDENDNIYQRGNIFKYFLYSQNNYLSLNQSTGKLFFIIVSIFYNSIVLYSILYCSTIYNQA